MLSRIYRAITDEQTTWPTLTLIVIAMLGLLTVVSNQNAAANLSCPTCAHQTPRYLRPCPAGEGFVCDRCEGPLECRSCN